MENQVVEDDPLAVAVVARKQRPAVNGADYAEPETPMFFITVLVSHKTSLIPHGLGVKIYGLAYGLKPSRVKRRR
jgi:hypothetical protein